MFPLVWEGCCIDGGMDDVGACWADCGTSQVEDQVGAGVGGSPGVDGLHGGGGVLVGEVLPGGQLGGLCGFDGLVDAVHWVWLGREVTIDFVDLDLAEVG